MPRHSCVFCGYSRNNRTYRSVGTEEHPDDVVCNLCDTQEGYNGPIGEQEQVSAHRSDARQDKSRKDSQRMPVALWSPDPGGRTTAAKPSSRVPRKP